MQEQAHKATALCGGMAAGWPVHFSSLAWWPAQVVHSFELCSAAMPCTRTLLNTCAEARTPAPCLLPSKPLGVFPAG